MATYNQLPVYKATYDLLLYVYQTGKDVQRDYRYTLGETLKRDLITILPNSSDVSYRPRYLRVY